MKFRLVKQIDRVYAAYIDTPYNLGMTFVRIQEYYESPKFKGKHFSLEDFMDYWANKHGEGSFDYPMAWSGFNVPGKAIKGWMKKFPKNDMREKEEALLNRFLARLKKDNVNLEDSYLIGVSSKDKKEVKETIRHEIAHALYLLYPKYKKSCNAIFKRINKKPTWAMRVKAAEEKLISMGYCNNVLLDELQAYWSTSEPTRKDELESYDIFKKNLQNFLDSLS